MARICGPFYARSRGLTAGDAVDALAALFDGVTDSQNRHPYRDQQHRDLNARRQVHDHRDAGHEQQAQVVAERVPEGFELRHHAFAVLAARNFRCAGLIIAQLITSADTTNAISSSKARRGSGS